MKCSRHSYYLFTLIFLTKQNGNGKTFFLFPFCLGGRAMCLSREHCGTGCTADDFVL
jgi:hypothetical protein